MERGIRRVNISYVWGIVYHIKIYLFKWSSIWCFLTFDGSIGMMNNVKNSSGTSLLLVICMQRPSFCYQNSIKITKKLLHIHVTYILSAPVYSFYILRCFYPVRLVVHQPFILSLVGWSYIGWPWLWKARKYPKWLHWKDLHGTLNFPWICFNIP